STSVGIATRIVPTSAMPRRTRGHRRTGFEPPRSGVELPRPGVELPRPGVELPRSGFEPAREPVLARVLTRRACINRCQCARLLRETRYQRIFSNDAVRARATNGSSRTTLFELAPPTDLLEDAVRARATNGSSRTTLFELALPTDRLEQSTQALALLAIEL